MGAWRWMGVLVGVVAFGAGAGASAQEPCPADLCFDGAAPAEGAFFEVPFEVPAGIAEVEVRLVSLTGSNILDWGVFGPDRFRGYGGGNTEPAVMGEQAASRSYLPGPITPGTWRVYVGKARIDETPALYHIEVYLRATATLEPQPERTPYVDAGALSHEARWYAGDLHVHSRESGDAQPTVEEVAAFAESRGLDFIMLSEHNTVSQLELYAQAQADHPMLLFVPGIEVTTYSGHANAIGATEWIDHRIGFQGFTAQAAVDDTHAQGALFSISHPVLDLGDACIGCAWSAPLDGHTVDAVEIQTGSYSLTGALFFNSAIAFWEDLVANGHRVAAVGGSDDHSAGGFGQLESPIGSPTTMVWAEELSAAAIVEGIRTGRTVVKLNGPEDPMVELDADGREGDTVVASRALLRVRVTDVPPAGASLRLVRKGQAEPLVEVLDDPFVYEVEVQAPSDGQDWIRAELLVAGTPRVVTSHLFVTGTGGGGGRCEVGGTSQAPPNLWWAGLVGLALAGVLLATRRRGRRTACESRAARGTGSRRSSQ
jgi:hypothetical protein